MNENKQIEIIDGEEEEEESSSDSDKDPLSSYKKTNRKVEESESESKDDGDSLDHILAKPPEEKDDSTDNYMNVAESFFAMIDEMEKLKTENKSMRMHLKKAKKTMKDLNKENETLTIENQRFDLLFSQGNDAELDADVGRKLLELQNQCQELKRQLRKSMTNEKRKDRAISEAQRSIRLNEAQLTELGFEMSNIRVKHKQDLVKLHRLRGQVENLQTLNCAIAEDMNAMSADNQDQQHKELLKNQERLQEENRRLNEHLIKLRDSKDKQDGQVFDLMENINPGSRKEMSNPESRIAAEKEFFYLCCVSCQINLHEQFERSKDLDVENSVLTIQPDDIWRECSRDQVPMNHFYTYIDAYLRNLINVNQQLLGNKKKKINRDADYCLLM